MSVAIRKLEGVDSVNVSLNKGFADVRLKPGNRIDTERIRQVVRDNGFTPKGADVKLAGEVVERSGKLAVAMTGLDVVYMLVEHAQARDKLAAVRKAVGSAVLITGHIPEAKTGPALAAPRTLELLDFTVEQK